VSLTVSSDEAEHGETRRSRFNGPDAQITTLLDKLMKGKQGKNYLRYSEAERPNKAPVQVKLIQAQHELLTALHCLQDNLSFKKSQLARVAKTILDNNANEWGLDKQHWEQWSKVFCMRLRNLCYVVAKNERKPKPPQWVQQLPWRVAPEEPAAVDEKTAAKMKAKCEVSKAGDTGAVYLYAFDKELSLGYRVRQDRTGEKEYSLPLSHVSGQQDTDQVLGVWPSGDCHPISDLTVADLKLILTARGQIHEGVGNLWEGEHVKTHAKLALAQRTDRALLISFYVQGKQWLQVKADAFGELPGKQPGVVANDHPTMKKALQIMEPICVGFMTDVLKTKEDLKNARDEAFVIAGIKGTKKGRQPKPSDVGVDEKTSALDTGATASSSQVVTAKPAKPPDKKKPRVNVGKKADDPKTAGDIVVKTGEASSSMDGIPAKVASTIEDSSDSISSSSDSFPEMPMELDETAEEAIGSLAPYAYVITHK
jgi:hypothetical protein